MEEKTIYCPKCNVKAYEYDGRATTTIYAKCKSCHKIVCYCPSSDETYLKNKPYRATSSGIRFY